MVPTFVRVILIVVLVTACDESREMVIESDTGWSGAIVNASRDGYGSVTFPVSGSENWCWSIQKQTRGGYLKAYARMSGLYGTKQSGVAETTAQFGVVTGCSSYP
jgi:hypothetical protein